MIIFVTQKLIQLDNRMNGYTLSVGEAGLIIDIKEYIKNENI